MSSVLSVNDNTVRAALSGRALSRRVKLVFGFSVGLSRATLCIVNSLSRRAFWKQIHQKADARYASLSTEPGKTTGNKKWSGSVGDIL